MAGIFTYVTGNSELLGNGRKRQEHSSTWQEVGGKRLNSPAKGGGAIAGILTYMYMAGNCGLEHCQTLLGNGLKGRKIPATY